MPAPRGRLDGVRVGNVHVGDGGDAVHPVLDVEIEDPHPGPFPRGEPDPGGGPLKQAPHLLGHRRRGLLPRTDRGVLPRRLALAPTAPTRAISVPGEDGEHPPTPIRIPHRRFQHAHVSSSGSGPLSLLLHWSWMPRCPLAQCLPCGPLSVRVESGPGDTLTGVGPCGTALACANAVHYATPREAASSITSAHSTARSRRPSATPQRAQCRRSTRR